MLIVYWISRKRLAMRVHRSMTWWNWIPSCLLIERSRHHYLDYYRMHVALRLQLRARRAAQKVQRQIDIESTVAAPSEFDAVRAETPSALPSGFLSTTFHATLGYFPEGMPLAYLIATVLTGLGLWIGSTVHVSPPEQLARTSVPSTVVAQPKAEYVGRITGMVDCKWEKKGLGIRDWGLEKGSGVRGQGSENPPSTIHHPTYRVALGDQFALASGLMEITYDTGAKVILQGPVTYEVESNGGYLAVGKLTGKLEKRGEGREERGEGAANHQIRNPKSQILNPSPLSPLPSPLFVIHTPTATVTDLGTEFGVEVTEEGNTISHVFRGSVRLEVVAVDGEAEPAAQVLHENQSVRVEKGSGKQGGGNRVTLFVTPARAADFVRKIPKRTIKSLSLVDVVAGGDGFGEARGRGIISNTGELTDRPGGEQVRSDGYYHRVEGLPLIDGVFIPHGDEKRPVQLDSFGHTFAGFPETDGLSSGPIWAGGEWPSATSFGDQFPPSWMVLAIPYSRTHCCVCMPTKESRSTWRPSAGRIRNANSCGSWQWPATRRHPNRISAAGNRNVRLTYGFLSMAVPVFVENG